jgi:EXLDI family protein
MPNKTIYVANDDQPVFEQAQNLAGDNLSSVIVRALKEFIVRNEAQTKGFKEITIQVGSKGMQREKRFRGRLIIKWGGPSTDNKKWLQTRVFRTAKNHWAVELTRSPHPDFWRQRDFWKHSDYYDYTAETELLVFASVEAADKALPTALVKLMHEAEEREVAPVEYLDI